MKETLVVLKEDLGLVQHLHGGSQLSINSVPDDLKTATGLRGYQAFNCCTYIHTYTKTKYHTHKIKKLKLKI